MNPNEGTEIKKKKCRRGGGKSKKTCETNFPLTKSEEANVNLTPVKMQAGSEDKDFDNKTPMDSEKTTVVSPRAGGTGEFNAGELEMNIDPLPDTTDINYLENNMDVLDTPCENLTEQNVELCYEGMNSDTDIGEPISDSFKLKEPVSDDYESRELVLDVNQPNSIRSKLPENLNEPNAQLCDQKMACLHTDMVSKDIDVIDETKSAKKRRQRNRNKNKNAPKESESVETLKAAKGKETESFTQQSDDKKSVEKEKVISEKSIEDDKRTNNIKEKGPKQSRRCVNNDRDSEEQSGKTGKKGGKRKNKFSALDMKNVPNVYDCNYDSNTWNNGCNKQRDQYAEKHGYDNSSWPMINTFNLLRYTQVEGDLFDAPPEYSLAHCVAEDLNMGAGIAVNFKGEFKGVGELIAQCKGVGEVAVLEREGRFIYYLITKKRSSGKPTIISLQRSLEDMRRHIVEHKVTKLAIPQIACGLDRLDWDEVKNLLISIFKDYEMEIKVYKPKKPKQKVPKSGYGTPRSFHPNYSQPDMYGYNDSRTQCESKNSNIVQHNYKDVNTLHQGQNKTVINTNLNNGSEKMLKSYDENYEQYENHNYNGSYNDGNYYESNSKGNEDYSNCVDTKITVETHHSSRTDSEDRYRGKNNYWSGSERKSDDTMDNHSNYSREETRRFTSLRDNRGGINNVTHNERSFDPHRSNARQRNHQSDSYHDSRNSDRGNNVTLNERRFKHRHSDSRQRNSQSDSYHDSGNSDRGNNVTHNETIFKPRSSNSRQRNSQSDSYHDSRNSDRGNNVTYNERIFKPSIQRNHQYDSYHDSRNSDRGYNNKKNRNFDPVISPEHHQGDGGRSSAGDVEGDSSNRVDYLSSCGERPDTRLENRDAKK